jgi:hypothetical protein
MEPKDAARKTALTKARKIIDVKLILRREPTAHCRGPTAGKG